MKQFWITFVAALLGAALALTLYDALVVQPRTAAAFATAAVPVHRVDLAQARSEAAQISADVDASIDRSVAKAREASQAQAGDNEKRRLAMEPLARAAMFRTALTEYYQTEGRWPAGAADAGLPATDNTRDSAGRISVGADGTITIRYDHRFAPGTRIRLSPDDAGGMVQWLCRSEGDPDLPRFVPACPGQTGHQQIAPG